MRAVFNMSTLRSRGARQLGMGIVKGLQEVAPEFPILLLAPQGVGFEALPLPAGTDLEVYPWARSQWQRYRVDEQLIPSIVRRYGADVLLNCTNSGPSRPPVPLVMGLWLSQFYTQGREYLRLYGPLERLRLGVKRALFGRALRNAAYFVTLSEIAAEATCRLYRYPRERTRVIPNSVDTSLLDGKPAQTPHADRIRQTDAVRCLMVCGYHSHKGHRYLPEAMRILSERLGRRAVCFVTVNPQDEGPRRWLESVRAQGMEQFIEVLFPVEDEELGEVYRAGDLLVFPTINEIASTTYDDAMYCGLPVVTSDLSFAHYLCSAAALFFDPEDPRDIADQAYRALTDTAERERMIRRGQEFFQERHWPWPQVAAGYVELMELGARAAG